VRYFPEFDFGAAFERDRPGAALGLLAHSIERGAGVVAIGPYTNLAMFEATQPGALSRVPVTVMGGHLGTPPPGYPQWGANMDYNIQADRMVARILFERLDPLMVPLRPCFDVGLRRVDLPALEAGGPIARLIARQAVLQCADNGFERLARQNPLLPADLLNFHWDPVASGAALGWDCVTRSELPLQLVVDGEGQLVFEGRPGGPVRHVVTDVDVERFRQEWLTRVLRV
jgi:inosine-uridine nucleoside N-ribohydrolase